MGWRRFEGGGFEWALLGDEHGRLGTVSWCGFCVALKFGVWREWHIGRCLVIVWIDCCRAMRYS